MSTPRKHLGPTAEEIVAQRKQEALKRKSEFFSSFNPAEESAESGIDAYTRPSSIGITSGSGGRHLGPTLDEVAELRVTRNAPSAAATTHSGSKQVGKVLGASGKFELTAGGPSREQVHALLNLGVTAMPKTKEEASSLIRELRDHQIAQRFGMQEMKKDGVVIGGHSPEPSAPAQPAQAPGAGPEEHLNMALRGLNMITRR